MKFYLCEIVHSKGAVNIAIPVNEVLGIGNKLFKAPEELGIFGFALHEGYLYPIVTHRGIENPIFKYFLILKEYGFGITRVLQEIEAVPTPLSPSTPTQRDKHFEKLTEYTGAIDYEGNIYYVYNLYYVTLPRNATVAKHEATERIEALEKTELSNQCVIINESFAVELQKVKTILPADLLTPFKTTEADGFIDYMKTIPVKELDKGKFVVILENVGFRTSKLELSTGKILTHQSTNEKYLETRIGTYKLLSD